MSEHTANIGHGSASIAVGVSGNHLTAGATNDYILMKDVTSVSIAIRVLRKQLIVNAMS